MSARSSFFTGAKLLDVRVDSVDAAVLHARRSRWRDVEIERSRLGSAELYETELSGVRISDCKLGFINLRGATLTDVEFAGCSIDELDLGLARLSRVALRDCRVATLMIGGARLADVDLRGTDFARIDGLDGLRGATVDEDQLAAIGRLLAEGAGIRIQ